MAMHDIRSDNIPSDGAKPAQRRLAKPGSANWLAMLEAAEFILLEEGYSALTSRRVAERLGVKQRLVYYYFQAMDDLIVATFRRLAERELARLRSARDGARPLEDLWTVCINTSDARLISEFTALANRNDALRAEVIAFIETSRVLQVEALRGAGGTSDRYSIAEEAMALLATSLALSLTREAGLGVTMGHREARQVVQRLLRQMEP
jgi:AcrR family transcriptional regulator